MPTKKSIQKKSNDTGSFDLQKLMQSSDSYKSLIYGIVTVVVLFVVIALGIRTLQQNKAQIDEEALSTQSGTQMKTQDSDRHTVVAGETLWSIAEKSYNDGFKWEVIAKANNITDASVLENGTQLIIPKDEAKLNEVVSPTTAPTMAPPTPTVTKEMTMTAPPTEKISANTYTVVHGDTLWDISVRAYGDGYRWVELAKVNNLTNPNLIFSGNVLTLPRP